ncbi:stereocilin-like [Hemiscyllium ocellatum]|uniref:stereocilin-like n=1 Tax=Hemiscyllium ocellatum TaxID=170820 RepID=UPI0029673183|nr:stereocilin-like [Hemiscyllium ocellatum]
MAAILSLVVAFMLLVSPPSTGNKMNLYVEVLKDLSRLLRGGNTEGRMESIAVHGRAGIKSSQRIHAVISKLTGSFRTLSTLRQSNLPAFLTKRTLDRKRLSAFLYNISLYLQNNDLQDPADESVMLNGLDPGELEVDPPPRALLELKDLFVSLRASRDLDSLIEFLQIILDFITEHHLFSWLFQRQNWESLIGLIETVFQTLLNGTYEQASAGIQELMCSLMGQGDCAVEMEWLKSLGNLLDLTNWKPVVNLQSHGPPQRIERFQPWNRFPETGSSKTPGPQSLNSAQSVNSMHSLLQILSKPSGRRSGSEGLLSANQSQSMWSEDVLWDGLEELKKNILQNVGTSVYKNFKRQVSRMTGSLAQEVTSVIGMPRADHDGKCSVGDLRQLLLWGIRNNISWNIPILGFSSQGFLTETPFLACSRLSDKVRDMRRNSHTVSKRSGETVKGDHDFPYTGTLEAACNDSMPRLPGISNFTIYLYCNLFNQTTAVSQAPPDLRAACSDAAWYFSAVQEDLYWVQVCRQFYTSEFNSTVCSNVSLLSRQDFNQLCARLQSGSRKHGTYARNCGRLSTRVSVSSEEIQACLLAKGADYIHRLCLNETFLTSVVGDKRLIMNLCRQRNGLKMEAISLIMGDQNGTDFVNYLCSQMRFLKNVSVVEPWIIPVCSWLTTNSEEINNVNSECHYIFQNSSIEKALIQECILHLGVEYIRELCFNRTFLKDLSGAGAWSSLVCAHTIRSLEGLQLSTSKCYRGFEVPNATISDFQECTLMRGTTLIHDICANGTSLNVEWNVPWLNRFCNLLDELRRALSSLAVESLPLKCDYKTWSYKMLINGSLLASCKAQDSEGLKQIICQNATLYDIMSQLHPWVINYCVASKEPQDEECFVGHWLDKLPIALNLNTTQLCQNPTAFLTDLLDRLNQCDDQAFSWISNANYILQVFNYILDLSSLNHSEKEVQEVLSEAILLSSLMDNDSFWEAFNPNASISILQTVDSYLKEETDRALKNDLLNCFSPVLWTMLQNEEDSPALRDLFQEYLLMPQENLQKILMSAESESIKKLLSHMHRAWRQLQVSQSNRPALETFTAAFLQKFPRVTPDLFVDLSQFLPFMSVSDIHGFPESLLLNDSVLATLRERSSDMSARQKRAFARRLLNTNRFGAVSSWTPGFLNSLQPLLPFLPIRHFQQLRPEQLLSMLDGFGNSSLDPAHGRYSIRTLLNSSWNLTVGNIRRLGKLICFASEEDLQLLLAAPSLSDHITSALLGCVSDRTIDTDGRVALLLATHLWRQNVSTVSQWDFQQLGSLLPVLRVSFLRTLPAHQRSIIISSIGSVPFSRAQVHQLVAEIIQNINVTVDIICQFAHFLPGFSSSVLRNISASVVASACPCFTPFLSQLTATQKAVILEAVRTVNRDAGSKLAQFGCLVPFVPLKDLVVDSESFLRNLSLFKNWAWSPQQAQFIFKKIQAASNITEHSIHSLGNVAWGADCATLREQTADLAFLELIRFLSELPGGIRQSLRKCIVKELDLRPGISQRDILLMGPEMVINLPLKFFTSFPNDSIRTILDHVTRHTTRLLTLLPHKRSFLAEKALQLLGIGPNDEISGETLDSLGPLVTFIDETLIKQINPQELVLRLDEVKGYCIPEENKNAFGWMLTRSEVLGAAPGWTVQQMESVGRLVFILSPDDIHKLPKEVLTAEVMELVLLSEGRWGVSDIGRVCQEQQSQSAHTALLSKRLSLVTTAIKSITKKRRDGIPNCVDIRATFPMAWSSSQLAAMADNEFADCLEILTRDRDLSAEHLKILLSKTKQLYGSLRLMKLWQLLQMGRAVTQLSDRDFQNLDLSDLAVLAFLGEVGEWSEKQRRAGFSSFLRRSRQSVSELDATSLTALGHLICGMAVTEIERINPEEFSKAVLFLGGLKLSCSEAQLEALARLTTLPQAFGLVSNWGPEIFTEIGSVAAGLPDVTLSSLVEHQIEGLTPSAISLIVPSKFAVVFNADQLSSLSSAQASAVTSKQYEKLSPEQRRAVSTAQYDGEIHQEQRGKNHAGRSAWPQVATLFLGLSITYHLVEN